MRPNRVVYGVTPDIVHPKRGSTGSSANRFRRSSAKHLGAHAGVRDTRSESRYHSCQTETREKLWSADRVHGPKPNDKLDRATLMPVYRPRIIADVRTDLTLGLGHPRCPTPRFALSTGSRPDAKQQAKSTKNGLENERSTCPPDPSSKKKLRVPPLFTPTALLTSCSLRRNHYPITRESPAA